MTLLELRGIGMEYGAIRALAEVDYTVAPGEIVGLIGDNGAGKSTLVKIIAGNFPPTHGTMHFDGREVRFRGPEDARNAGIEVVYQDLALADMLLDEPTASISVRQVVEVLELMRRMRDHGQSVIFISHAMPHIFAVADRITVLRRGQKVADKRMGATSPEEVTALITGAVERGLMARASEAPVLPARLRPALWRNGMPQTQTAYVAVAFAVLIVVIWVLAPVFMTPRNLLNISKNFSFIALMSLGETLVIISGGIDLSVGSVCALSAVVTMMLMRLLSATAAAQVPGATIALAALGALALAVLIGLVNGLFIARIRLSPFVTTLGMLSVARGMTYVLTQGRAQYPVGPDVAVFTRFTNGAVLGLPTQLDYLLVLAVIMALALRRLVWGRHLYAVGGNAQAAALTGVRVPRVIVSVYVLSGLAAGFSGVLIAGWLGAAPANLATGYELRVIAAAVIGGANLAGGVGSAAGAVIGAALIEVIRNGFVLIGANTYWEEVFVGVIIIIAVLVDQLRTRRVV